MTIPVNIREQLKTRRDCGIVMHLIKRKDRSKHLFVRSKCGSWTCPSCREVLRKDWLNHLRTTVMSLNKVTVFRADKSQQDNVARRVTRAGGQYATLELASGVLLFLSDVLASGFKEVTKINALSLIDDALQHVADRKPIHTSRGWSMKLAKKTDKTPEWEKVGKTETKIEDIERIAVALKLPVGYFWDRQSTGIVVELPPDWDEADNTFIKAISESGGQK